MRAPEPSRTGGPGQDEHLHAVSTKGVEVVQGLGDVLLEAVVLDDGAPDPHVGLGVGAAGPAEADVDAAGIQHRQGDRLLGHNQLSSTARYTQVATHTIRATRSPLDRLTLEVVPPG